ncbi:hypothetical protein QTL97_08385 [Sporosarcina thermotolerans]|uniref:Uncharacterized protein n=1 Tax=Sporosarcina thermotolerans TaxID=633404 RepID=A0AAW9A7F8_9BACL|nr:hypothetical protein [Sporosarcina thermotolerans]MDW0116949.1 hypothetical protein [Sporosarcina thermotolerans]WHT47934.1 hypothetical protein QNH10_17970 [Sporosarcina thermotolerans]
MAIYEITMMYGIVPILVTLVGGLLLKNYLPNYMNEKGKNHATKEDIADITRRTEEVKSEFLSKLEVEKKEINIEIEKMKLEQGQILKNFELYTQKRHECYPELYKLLEIATVKLGS